MPAAPRAWAADLLNFWFYQLGPGDWFEASACLDDELRRRYSRWLSALRMRPAREFLTDPLTARAAVLLFDQVPRNIHRGSGAAFASDPLARSIARAALARAWDRDLGLSGRQFLAMPLMHSEAIADQRASLAYFAALGSPEILAFARSHHRMIARFGRFPHRNAVLGRPAAPAERAAVQLVSPGRDTGSYAVRNASPSGYCHSEGQGWWAGPMVNGALPNLSHDLFGITVFLPERVRT